MLERIRFRFQEIQRILRSQQEITASLEKSIQSGLDELEQLAISIEKQWPAEDFELQQPKDYEELETFPIPGIKSDT